MAFNGTIVTASTSVVLVDTSSGVPPYIVYFPYISTVGRYITVRDNNGYASTGNSVIISTLPGAYFPDNQSTILISQPYGFVTFSVQSDGYFSILNTFAFPTGSDSAYVYTINTNNVGIKDDATNAFNYITASTGSLYLNNTAVGEVTNGQLTTAIQNLTTSFIDTLNISQVVREYLAVGTSISTVGTIQISSDLGIHWYNAPSGTQGFINGGTDITNDIFGYFVACGNNDDGTNTPNLGYIQWSFDGRTWYNSSSPLLDSTQQRTRVHWGNGIWHALGTGENGQSILWSKDYKNWNSSITTTGVLNSNLTYNGIAYQSKNNVWVAGGQNISLTTSLLWSSNGSNWNTIPNLPNIGVTKIYDVIYDGTNFIAMFSNTNTSNSILVSPNGSNNWSFANNTILNNEPGFLGGSKAISIVVGETYSKYSLNNGYDWTDMTGFPSGIPTRPYYDGSIWWVGMNDLTAVSSNVYTSPTGNSQWISTNSVNLFPTGFPNSIISLNTSGNLNIQLLSTVYGIQQSIHISSLQVDTLSVNTFTFDNTNSSVLNIISSDPTAVIYTNIISTNIVETNTLILENLNINSLSAKNLTVIDDLISQNFYGSTAYISTLTTDISYLSELYISTLYATDVINTITLNADTISSADMYVSSLYIMNTTVDNLIVSTISVTDNLIVLSNASVENLTVIGNSVMNVAYIDVTSTNHIITSTMQLLDVTGGSLNDLYSENNKLLFRGVALETNISNPLYFVYELIDITGAPPDNGQLSISNSRLDISRTIELSTIDYNGVLLRTFFSRVGINCIIHVINPNTASDNIFRIDSKSESDSSFLFNITQLAGRSEIAQLNRYYNIFIESIGIPPPVTPPSNIATIYAPLVSGAFNFNSGTAYASIPIRIGTYIPGNTSFGINLNNNNYSLTNIPAIVGTIVYFTGTNGFVVANVKCGSISAANGAYITIDQGVGAISISGLTLNNFPGAVNNMNTGSPGFSIFITLQFLN